MGKRKPKQNALFFSAQEIPQAASHPFYTKVNDILERNKVDKRLEHLCKRFYKPVMGRPSMAPGVYFRMLLLGYFEGIDSERGIAWRVADSLSLRDFLGFSVIESTPDHSTMSRTRRLMPVETHKAVFRWFVKVLGEEGLMELTAALTDPRAWDGKEKEQKQVYGNRRRMRGRRGKDLQKLRTELTERSFAHMYETGGMRRTHLKGQKNILKRLLFHAVGFNLALLVRKSSGIGKPRTLQGLSDTILLVQIAMTAWTARWNELAGENEPISGSFSLRLVFPAPSHS